MGVVQAGSGLIQQNNLCVGGKSRGNGHPLFLPAGKCHGMGIFIRQKVQFRNGEIQIRLMTLIGEKEIFQMDGVRKRIFSSTRVIP